MSSELSGNTTLSPEERFNYLRTHSAPELRELDRQIKDIKDALDKNFHKIKIAKKRHEPFSKLNELQAERKALIRKLKNARGQRNQIKAQIDSAKQDRNLAGSRYIQRQKHYYAELYSNK